MPGAQGEDEAMSETTALRIGTGLDAVTVSGLTGDERAEVIASWARCGVEAVEPPARADAHRDADTARPWLASLPAFATLLIAALIVGVVRGLTAYAYPPATEAAVYGLMVLVLLLRPRGLFGEHIARFE